MLKAFAKACGSYKSTESGYPFEALITLTGAPYSSIRLDASAAKGKKQREKLANLWSQLKLNDDKGYLQTASTPGEDTLTIGGDRGAGEGAGLVPGHAYALIQVKETTHGHRLVQLRNPWGRDGMEWTGAWSDSDPRWTPELRQELHYVVDDGDGLFWMDFGDFAAHFDSVDCSMIKHSRNGTHWFESRERITFKVTFRPVSSFSSGTA